MQSEDFQQKLWAVLSFLNEEGFSAASSALLSQVQSDPRWEGGPTSELQSLLAAIPAPGSVLRPLDQLESELERQRAPAASSSGRSKQQQFIEQSVPWGDAVNEYDNQDDTGYSRRDVAGQAHFVETEIDLQSDTRSIRSTDQLSTGHLPHTGLLGGDDGEEDGGAGDTSGGACTGGPASSAGGPKTGVGSTCGSSISGAVIDLAPSTSTSAPQHQLAPPASPREGAPALADTAALQLFPSSVDAWDLGPVGIRIADPVTTPTKSSGNAGNGEGESRPVLSRVESLSSSFKDFDIEGVGADDEQHTPLRRVSGTTQHTPLPGEQPAGVGLPPLSLSDPAGAHMADEIDFHPVVLSPTGASSSGAASAPAPSGPPTLAATPQLPPAPALALLTSAEPPSADIDLGPPLGLVPDGSPEPDLSGLMTLTQPVTVVLAPPVSSGTDGAAGVVAGAGPEGGGGGSGVRTLGRSSGRGNSSAAASGGGCGGCGGFSFPVATTPSEHQPDHRLFKSWPSVRSSCTSEVIAASDDDHMAADYADDEYLRCMSKPTSRTASQSLGDLGGACIFKTSTMQSQSPPPHLVPRPSAGAPPALSAAGDDDGPPAGGGDGMVLLQLGSGSGSGHTPPSPTPPRLPQHQHQPHDVWPFATVRRPPPPPPLQPLDGGPALSPSASVAAPGGSKLLSGVVSPAGKSPSGKGLGGVSPVGTSPSGTQGAVAISEPSSGTHLSGGGSSGNNPAAYNTCLPPSLVSLASSKRFSGGLQQSTSGRWTAGGGMGSSPSVLSGAGEGEGAAALSSPAASSRQPTPSASGPLLAPGGDAAGGGGGGFARPSRASSGGVGGAGGASGTRLVPVVLAPIPLPPPLVDGGVGPPGAGKSGGRPGAVPLLDLEPEQGDLAEDVSAYGDEEDEDGDEKEQEEVDEAVAVAQGFAWQTIDLVPSGSADGPPPLSLQRSSAPAALCQPSQTHLTPRYTINEDSSVTYEYDPEYIARKYEVLDLRVYHRRQRTGFEETKDFPLRIHDLIAGRYQVVDFLGSAAFSRAVQALDIKTNVLVCLKIIKNNKDYLDQSLDEIKLLKYVNLHDPEDKFGVVRLYDYFYYKEHLFLVCELLRANLYEFQKYNRESGDAPYFTNARIRRIAHQVLRSLSYLHALSLIHSDLKPENILIRSYSKCEVKVIDLGSSCFITDQLSSYVQSRSYRAPEVILGLPYDQKVDVWSLGCILAELSSGQVLFQNDSLATLLARLEGILGPVPRWMVHKGRYAHRYYTRSGQLYEKNAMSERYELLMPKRTSLRHRVPDADEGLLSFISYLLHVDPHKRPTAVQALQHPWLRV